ncbi:permease for cytosine/purines, uracil, thiamine, allantoin-domain-containing protein [Xylariales sp. PMI_506]|nr:permease for cytosine/purines, uracil, thiamine, allantoin-domain-containing protein [Xylariales sp. PMI_506]
MVQHEDKEIGNGDVYLSNSDLQPIPVENRIWGKLTYSLFWFGECASVTSWTVASTRVKAGLAWWEAWICVIFGHLIVAFFMVAIGRPGANYHLGFPTIARASFGIFGSLWPIINRDVMTVVWTGVQGVTAGNSIYVMLHAIFPTIANVPNPFSSDVTMIGGRLIGFNIGWILTLACTFVQVHKFRPSSKPKALAKSVHQGSSIPPGGSHAWIFLNQLFVQAANMATFATNNSDLARYARKPSDALWPQLLGMPLAYGIIGFFGIFITSASGPGRRAAVFFIAAGFSFAQVTTQIFPNLIAAGNDTAALLPRYINIRRGSILCLIIAFAITPWNLLKTSFTFTSYLSSYQIFLNSIIGVILADYFYVRRGYMHVPDLFTREPQGLYWYAKGWNWRAYVAYVIGIVPCFPGFLYQCGLKIVPIGAQRLYIFALPLGILVSGIAYILCCHISPPAGGLQKGWRESNSNMVGATGNARGFEEHYDEKAWRRCPSQFCKEG